jgi:hypothetical protein
LSIVRPLAGALACAAFTLVLNGCSYDYLQHTDRVAYSAGDAVKANLESETINPSKRSMYYTRGLGKTGLAGSSPAAPSTGTTTTTTPASTAAAPAVN